MLSKKKKPRNKFERSIYHQLRRRRLNYEYESEKIPYVLSGHYIPDFVIKLPSGDKIYIETKGYLRPEDKRKLVAVKKCHPTFDIRILFYKYVEQSVRWAERQGFDYAIESLPDRWFSNIQREVSR